MSVDTENRLIFHFDIDAFFASVEEILDPSLKGKAVIVGGTAKRGVVSTASYEARKYGVHSAMSTAMAKQLCPHGIFIRGSFDAYRQYSKRVFEVMSEATPLLEHVGIDEGFLDLTDTIEGGFSNREASEALAMSLKEKVHAATGLTISIGISYNKFLAKLASDWKKPDGLFRIAPEDVRQLLDPLPILKVHGLGKKSAERLKAVGIYTIADLMDLPLSHMGYFLGASWAKEIHERIRGIDPRPIITEYERKSYGKETTFDEDVTDFQYLEEVLKAYAVSLHQSLLKHHLQAKTVTVKVKFDDFQQITRSHSIEGYSDDLGLLVQVMCHLLAGVPRDRAVRLIGVTFSNVVEADAVQISFWEHLGT